MLPTIAPARAPVLTLFGDGVGRLVCVLWVLAVLDAVGLATVLLDLRGVLEGVTEVVCDGVE
jgi:hypothetical protein